MGHGERTIQLDEVGRHAPVREGHVEAEHENLVRTCIVFVKTTPSKANNVQAALDDGGVDSGARKSAWLEMERPPRQAATAPAPRLCCVLGYRGRYRYHPS